MSINQHNAIVLDGDRNAALDQAKAYLTDVLELSVEANPDVSVLEHDRFGIDEVRTLKHRAAEAPFGDKQVFIIAAQHFTREAQNALLKLLEEPAPHTFFMLVVPNLELLLPTVRSRLHHAATHRKGCTDLSRARAFSASTIGERITMVAKIAAAKDRTQAREFLDELEQLLHERGVRREHTNLGDIVFARRYLSDTSSSLKMLLEHIAVTFQSPSNLHNL